MNYYKKGKIILRRVVTSLLLIMVLVSSFYNVFAFSIGDNEIYSKGECERLLTYRGTKVITTFVVYNKNGVEYPAYCLDVTKDGAEKGSYIVNGGSKIQDVGVWRAIVNGYPYKSLEELGAANEGEAFTATKHAVYTVLYGRSTDDYGPIDSDAGRRTYEIYKNIVNTARSSEENMVTDIITSLSTNDLLWNIDSKDPNFVSKTYKLNSNVSQGKYNIHCDRVTFKGMRITDLNNNDRQDFTIGEEFKILIPINALTSDGSFEIVAKTDIESRPVAYGSSTVPGKQDYALTGYKYEEQYTGLVQEYSKNITKLNILKKEYGSNKPLAGVKFDLLNDKNEVIYKDLVTDSKGNIILENMIPGKYYLQEKETLEGYVLYTDLIEIGLDYNEEFEVTVNNKKKEVSEYVKDYEGVEVTPSKEETKVTINTIETSVNKGEKTDVSSKEIVKSVNNTEKISLVENGKTITKLPKTGY